MKLKVVYVLAYIGDLYIVASWSLWPDSDTGFWYLGYDVQTVVCYTQISIDIMKLDVTCVVTS